MTHPYTRLLRDEELRPHLQAGDAVAFVGLADNWRNIERQVEHLGFGDSYAVSKAKKQAGEPGLIRVSPIPGAKSAETKPDCGDSATVILDGKLC
jgi:hypothetical protein